MTTFAPEYLGDSVYASFDGYHIWLRTGSHKESEATNNIALEPSVFAALVAYQRKTWTMPDPPPAPEQLRPVPKPSRRETKK